ncbi:MAG: permease-like cell division protein FtsX, partial [Muribaculaceae bacterium]|nr:permease-like cell division protein FtsX [Muribaculaceae bacterium]
MKKGKEVKISYWAAHATTIVSVTLVLLIIGIIALVTTSARQETRRLKESLEISVIMADSISDAQASVTLRALERQPFCRNLRLITRREALEAWKAHTGEDLEALIGLTP